MQQNFGLLQTVTIEGETFTIRALCHNRSIVMVGAEGVVGLSKTVERQGWRDRAYRDVFTACFGKPDHPLRLH